jgi:hypothetical protein
MAGNRFNLIYLLASFNLTNYLYNLSGTDHIAAALKFTYLYFTEMNIY